MTIEEFLDQWHSADDTLVVHTSGSTGQPKPIRVSKARMRASARMTCDYLSLQPGNKALLCMPLDYIAGKMMVVRSLERGLLLYMVEPSSHPLREGQKVRMLTPEGKVEEGTLPEAFDFVAMVPLQVHESLQVPAERGKLAATRHLIVGGGAVDDALTAALKDFPFVVWSTYGMTETLSHIALRRLNGSEATAWYEPMTGVTVGKDERGCLWIEAPRVCEQRLFTNDCAELRPDGSFRILGRIDNVIDSGGIKIQIEEVEERLKAHLTAPFLITKVPDEKFGEAVTLLTTCEDVATVEATCRQWLPAYHCPRHVWFVRRLPQTETGKPARAEAERLARSLLR